MIKVELVSHTNVDPLDLASHAALVCYQAEAPEMGKRIDVENRLFKVGHHTTLQHNYFTFQVENIAVSDITFGMHLPSPFYNSDQKSGRYCAKMFTNPDFGKIEEYIKFFWPEAKNRSSMVMNYIMHGVDIYRKNIDEANVVAAKFIKKERPFISEKYIEQNAPKIAQEQMRMFIPTIFPTTFDFTVNLTTLVAMWEAAWTPATKYVTDKMAKLAVEKFPEIQFMFDEKRRRSGDWVMRIPNVSTVKAKYQPKFKLLEMFGEKDFIIPEVEIMHPVDKLHFLPEMMDNSVGTAITQVEISTATMGQDQRHRTIGRSQPKFTGAFYLPPIPRHLGMERAANLLMKDWIGLAEKIKIPGSMAMILAPYGAMVTYKKRGSFNAIAHEQGKRLCWCAQEEIYHLGRSFRLAIEKKYGKKSKLLRIFEPPCYRTGKCAEGARYCGRDLKLRKTGDYFPKRRV